MLRDLRLNPNKYSEAFQTVLMRKLGADEKIASSLVRMNNSVNQIQLLSESLGGNNPALRIDTAFSSMKMRLEKMKADLTINIQSKYRGIFTDSPTMKEDDIVEAKGIISEIDREIERINFDKSRSKRTQLNLLNDRYDRVNRLKKKFISSDQKSLLASDEFQESMDKALTVQSIVSTLAQSTAIQLATLTGGPAGSAAMAIAFCIFQKEYERYSLSEGRREKTDEELSQFHQDVVSACAIEGATAAAAGKISVSAMDRIDAKFASKAMTSAMKILSNSGINIATSTSSSVLTNLFASSASLNSGDDVCKSLARSIQAEISQYSTPEGVGIVLLQSLIFKKNSSNPSK